MSYDLFEALDSAIRFVTVPDALGQDRYSEGEVLAEKVLREAFADGDATG